MTEGGRRGESSAPSRISWPGAAAALLMAERDDSPRPRTLKTPTARNRKPPKEEGEVAEEEEEKVETQIDNRFI